MQSEQEMRAAVVAGDLACDSACDGRFFCADISSGVFCRPSCPARAAHPEHRQFFADAAGFSSISRVYGEASRCGGMTPQAYRAGGAGETMAYACRDTALGPLMMAATERGVAFAQFGEDSECLLAQLQAEFPQARIIASAAQHSPELDAWIVALDAHISQGAPRPDLPLDLRGTAFQMLVWRFLLQVREGEVITYSELAAGIERPQAVRAAASACAANRIGVLVPCHRVLRGDGHLGGYRWGLERKKALLDAEQARLNAEQARNRR